MPVVVSPEYSLFGMESGNSIGDGLQRHVQILDGDTAGVAIVPSDLPSHLVVKYGRTGPWQDSHGGLTAWSTEPLAAAWTQHWGTQGPAEGQLEEPVPLYDGASRAQGHGIESCSVTCASHEAAFWSAPFISNPLRPGLSPTNCQEPGGGVSGLLSSDS